MPCILDSGTVPSDPTGSNYAPSTLEVFGDVGSVEVVHLVDHVDRGGDDGEGT